MKDMPIGKLLEAVKTGTAAIMHQVQIDGGLLFTYDQSAFVHMLPNRAEYSEYVDNRALSDAIRERCAG